MMNSKTYKTLFEVHVLHDYFLTNEEGKSYFSLDKDDKEISIGNSLINGTYNVNEIISIEPLDRTIELMNSYNLKFKKTSLGFILVAEVLAELIGGETFYRPSFSFPNNLNLAFKIKAADSEFKSITNLSFRNSMPLQYYITNKDKVLFDEPNDPLYKSLTLSAEIAPVQLGVNYEMGALIDDAGVIKESLQADVGTIPIDQNIWEDTEDLRYITESDKILVPSNFNYNLRISDNINQIDITVLDSSSSVIKTINRTDANPLEYVNLDLSLDDNNLEIPKNKFYTLNVSQGGVPSRHHRIYMSDELYDKSGLGVVDMRFDELNSPFSLLDTNGFLKTKIDMSNNNVKHPVFEIRLKNRRTYWRYNKDEAFILDQTSDLADHLTEIDGKLVSKKPKPLTKSWMPFKDGNNVLMLAHPSSPSVKVDQGKVYSEIFINQSNRLFNS